MDACAAPGARDRAAAQAAAASLAVAGPRATLPFLASRWGRRRIGTVRDRPARPVAAGRGPGRDRPAVGWTATRARPPSAPGSSSAACRSGSASTPRGPPVRAPSSADVREYVPGDRQRSINWPATTRRGRLQVNTFQAERSQDVIILVEHRPGTAAIRRAQRAGHRAARRRRRGPCLPGGQGPGGLHHLPVPGPVAGPGPRRSGTTTGSPRPCWPRIRAGPRTPDSPGCPGRRCHRAR